MSDNLKPYIRLLVVIAVGFMLYYMPTREFLKITFMLGMPFIFLLGFMVRRPRYSLVWSVCALGLVAGLGLYGYFLVHLPQRVQVREIISNGAGLVAEGHYDEAIEKYKQLENLGKPEQMKQKITEAETEKAAQEQLELARQQINAGNTAEALRIIDAIPGNTRAGREAGKLKESIK